MSNVYHLRELYVKVESTIRNLNSLKVSSETYGTLFFRWSVPAPLISIQMRSADRSKIL